MADIIDVHYQPLNSFPTTSKIRVESPGNVEMGGKIDSIRLCVTPQWKTTLRYLSYVCTGFIMYLFNLWIPSLSIKMTLSDSNLRKAKKVVVYGADKNIEVVNLLTETTSTQTLKVFTYRLFKYYYDEKDQAFKACQFKIDHLTFTQIHETYGQGLEEENYQDNAIFFGKNLTDIPKKPWTTLLFQEVLSPFYIFQVYSVMVWAFDNYWVYGLMIIFFSVSSVTVTLYQTIKTTNKLRQMSYYEIPVYVHRRVSGTPKRIQVNSSELVPGDLMEIPEGVMMPCDAVILNGTCIMNEAMLTGESIPVIKNPFPMSDVHYNVKEDKQYTLFAGTKCIQARYYQGSAVFGLVTLTGFATVKGELIRTMLFPKPTDFKFYSDSFKFVGILAAVAIAGFLIDLPSWINSHQDGMAERIIIKASEIITITVPPALPTCMQIGISVALARLKKKQIFCISPAKINEAGRVNVMCFDKTGTLTEDGLDLLGVRPVIYDKNSKKLGFSKLVKKITTLSTANNSGRDMELHNISSKSPPAAVNLYERTKMLPPDHMQEILATCHSLTMVNGNMIGDPLDLKMFECTKWDLDEELNQFDDGERILARAVPLLQREVNSQDQTQNGTAILRRFEFSSKLQRMSVIVKNFADGNYKVHVKGSPEKIRELCRAESVPINFHSMLEKYTRDGYRVLACATKLLEPHHRVGAVQRDDVEKDFTFIGLLIMENKLKNITTQIIHQLHEAQIRTIMVTGDNALTAISVARQCNIISPTQRVFLGDLSEKKVEGKEVIQWKDFEFSDRVLNNNLDYDMEADSKLSGSFDFMNTSHKTLRVSEGGITLNGDDVVDPPNLPSKRQSNAKDLATSMRSNSMMKSNRLRNSSGMSGARISKVSAARLSQSGMKDQSSTEIKNINKKLLSSSANVVEVDAPFFAMEEDENYCIAVTGKAFSLILHEAEVNKSPQYQFILQQLLRKCLVFARMHPDEKALMIKHMMVISNNIVGMCGDGANDVGALKTANVGVSLSEAEASIAAPFTSNIQDISCIPTLLMEGRAALSTSYQAFKFMALYSIIQFSSVTLLFHELIDLTNWHYYHIDMLIILPLSGTMALTQTHDELTIFKPTGRLVSVQILSSVLGQGLIQILFQLGTLLILMNKSWYHDYSCINDFETYNPCVENTSLYLVSIYQYCTVAIVFMVGRPFRKPFYTNLWFTCIWCVLILINLIMTYNPFHWGFITEQSLEAEVVLYSSWKNEILAIVAINSTLTIIWERLVVRHVSIWWKNYRDEKQREKEERELQLQGNKMTTSNLLAY